MSDRYKAVLLFGPPGSGKGTQGQVLGAIPGFYHCSSGDVFRSLDRESELGKIFLDYSSRGELVPDDLTVRMWKQNMQQREKAGDYKPGRDLLVLDGIPRTVEQAKIMDDLIDALLLVHLVCRDAQAMVERLQKRAIQQGRHDDADENVIRNRWQVYEDETTPVIGHYPPNIVAEVEAVATPLQVFYDVLSAVKPVHEKHYPTFEM